jgi:heptosyltransferase-2
VKKIVRSFYLHARQAVLHGAGLVLRQRRLRPVPDPSKITNILFIRTDRIGDMVLSTATLRAIKRGFPRARLTVLASLSNAPLLQHDPHVDEVIVWNEGGLGSSLVGFLRRAARLSKIGYDAVIDPLTGNNLHTALIAYLSGAALRIGFPGYGREVFFNRLAAYPDKYRHMADLILETAILLGAESEDRTPQLCLLPAERDWAGGWLQAHSLGHRAVVGIHPGGYYPSQRWPLDYYAQLALALQQDHGCGVVLIGGRGDRHLIRSILASSGERFVVFESSDLRQTVAVISQLNVLVCNNSGPLHIATALNVPTLSFMGPTEKSHWMPLGNKYEVLRQDQLECIGCNSGTCTRGDLACMKLIKPEEALGCIIRLLKQETRNRDRSLVDEYFPGRETIPIVPETRQAIIF